MTQIVGHNKWRMTNDKDKYNKLISFSHWMTVRGKCRSSYSTQVVCVPLLGLSIFQGPIRIVLIYRIRDSWIGNHIYSDINHFDGRMSHFKQRWKLVAFATDNIDTGHMLDWNVTYEICINVFNFALQIVSFESIVGISW